MNNIINIPGVKSMPSPRKRTSFIVDEVTIFEDLLKLHMLDFEYCVHMAKYSKKSRVRKKYANKISKECSKYAHLFSN